MSRLQRPRRAGFNRRSVVAFTGAGVLIASLATASASFADDPGGCDFGATLVNKVPVPSCVGPLAGSTFAGGDGNLLTSPTTYGTSDWQSLNTASKVNVGPDDPSGSGDNAFGQGTKEDVANVTVVKGSIPPQKSDLTGFYEASETINGKTFLYLAWERTNILGTANMDFEINQQATPGFNGSTTGPITLNRQPGDLLITFDFTNGGGRPILGLNRWLTSASVPVVPGFSTNSCFSANTFPCWGDQVTLNGAVSEGAVNNVGKVTDPISNQTVDASEFGEAAINLNDAGVFQPGACTSFATTFLKSRSSTSFTAEVKDFVAPVPTSITNCGEVKIVKQTIPANVDQPFGYTSTLAGAEISCTPDTTPASFTLNAKTAADGTEDCVKVPFGSYTVTETQATNFVLDSLTCSTGGTQHAAGSLQADITISVANPSVTCTYVNKQQLGAIKISKTSSKGANPPLAGATFSITGPNSYSNSVQTGADGTVCVDNLPFGAYTVTETAAPTGYKIDDTTGHIVTVDNNAKCSDSTYVGETIGFADTPKADIQVNFRDGGSGATSLVEAISCTNADTGTSSTTAATGWDSSLTVTGLSAPVTLVCTIKIDP